jgi:hypothetical protein
MTSPLRMALRAIDLSFAEMVFLLQLWNVFFENYNYSGNGTRALFLFSLASLRCMCVTWRKFWPNSRTAQPMVTRVGVQQGRRPAFLFLPPPTGSSEESNRTQTLADGPSSSRFFLRAGAMALRSPSSTPPRDLGPRDSPPADSPHHTCPQVSGPLPFVRSMDRSIHPPTIPEICCPAERDLSSTTKLVRRPRSNCFYINKLYSFLARPRQFT